MKAASNLQLWLGITKHKVLCVVWEQHCKLCRVLAWLDKPSPSLRSSPLASRSKWTSSPCHHRPQCMALQLAVALELQFCRAQAGGHPPGHARRVTGMLMPPFWCSPVDPYGMPAHSCLPHDVNGSRGATPAPATRSCAIVVLCTGLCPPNLAHGCSRSCSTQAAKFGAHPQHAAAHRQHGPWRELLQHGRARPTCLPPLPQEAGKGSRQPPHPVPYI